MEIGDLCLRAARPVRHARMVLVAVRDGSERETLSHVAGNSKTEGVVTCKGPELEVADGEEGKNF